MTLTVLNNNITYQNVELVPIDFLSIENHEQKNKGNMIKSIDILGRTTNKQNNILINIYNNSIIEKNINAE